VREWFNRVLSKSTTPHEGIEGSDPSSSAKKMKIGIDIGGTKIRGILYKENKILKTTEIKTPQNLQDFKLVLGKIVNYLGVNKNVYIGVAGIVRDNIIIKSPNISYLKNFDLSKEKINLKSLKNDALCFAAGEYYSRQDIKEKNILFITIGTGIGRSIVKKGKLLEIKKLEKPEKWEKEYQTIREKGDNNKLAGYLKQKIKNLIKEYSSELIIIGGGISRKKGFYQALKKEMNVAVKRSKLGKNAVAIGAIKIYQK